MNTALPLLSLLHNGNYNGNPSLAENGFGRSYDQYASNGSDNESAQQPQGNNYNPSYYPYSDELSTFGLNVHHDQYGSRPTSSGHPPNTGGYAHLVGPDFASHPGQHAYRSDNNGSHPPPHSNHNGHANGDASRFLDLDLNQPGPSSYRHSSGIYSTSEASPDAGGPHSAVESRDEDHHSKADNGGSESAAPNDSTEPDNEEPLYVNAKQYHRILKRRMARARLEELNRLVRSRKPYLHESRHRHACSRPRGKGGRFLTADEIEQLKREEAAKAEGGASAESGAPSGSVSGEASGEGSGGSADGSPSQA